MYEYERNRRDKPKCCKDCEYYQPRWKYRFCYFVRCPYKLKDTTFRRTPLKKEYFPQKEVVRMSDVCVVSDDYIEIAHTFGSRVANEAELFKEQVKKLDIPITLITEADCIPDHYSKDINGKVIAIDPKVLKPEFQRADRQLYLVTGGFGASANSRGSAVFCTNLHTGKNTRYERMDVMGEVKPECMPDWAKEKIAAMNRSHKNKDRER